MVGIFVHKRFSNFLNFHARFILKDAWHALSTHVLKMLLYRFNVWNTQKLALPLIMWLVNNFNFLFSLNLLIPIWLTVWVKNKYFDIAICMKQLLDMIVNSSSRFLFDIFFFFIFIYFFVISLSSQVVLEIFKLCENYCWIKLFHPDYNFFKSFIRFIVRTSSDRRYHKNRDYFTFIITNILLYHWCL